VKKIERIKIGLTKLIEITEKYRVIKIILFTTSTKYYKKFTLLNLWNTAHIILKSFSRLLSSFHPDPLVLNHELRNFILK